jgi:hypothetical protein
VQYIPSLNTHENAIDYKTKLWEALPGVIEDGDRFHEIVAHGRKRWIQVDRSAKTNKA